MTPTLIAGTDTIQQATKPLGIPCVCHKGMLAYAYMAHALVAHAIMALNSFGPPVDIFISTAQKWRKNFMGKYWEWATVTL